MVEWAVCCEVEGLWGNEPNKKGIFMKDLLDLDLLTKRIKDKMEELKLNQAQLAKNAKITPAALSQILNKERTPSTEVLVKLARALGVSVDYLVGQSKDVEFHDLLQNSDVQVFFREFSGLSQSDKDQVKMMIEILKKKADKNDT